MATEYIDFFQLQNDFSKNNIKNIYLLYGEEGYLHNKVIENFKNYYKRTDKSTNFEIFYGENIDINNLINSINVLPLGIDKQVVIIKNYEKIKKAIAKKLDIFLNSGCFQSNNLLILLSCHDKKIPRNISLENIRKTGKIVSLKKPKTFQIKQWIRKKFTESDTGISDEAIYYLQQITDNDMGKINNEIEKILCYLGEDISKIEKKDIINSIYGSEEGNIFNFVDAIGERNTEKSLNILSKLVENGYHPLQLLTMISRQMKLIMQAKLYKVNIKQMQYDLRLPIFVINKIVNQSKYFKLNKIRHTFRLLLNAEKKLKTGYFNPVLVLEQLIIEITE